MSVRPAARPLHLSAEFAQNHWLRAPCLRPAGRIGEATTGLNFAVVQETLERMAPKDII